jgi:hypothetical protein
MIQHRFGGRRLIETMPARAIDLRPRLAGAVDALDALGDADCANALEAIRRRVDAWASQRFSGVSSFGDRSCSRHCPSRLGAPPSPQ